MSALICSDEFLSVAHFIGKHVAVHGEFILFLFANEIVHAVQSHSAVVADDTAAAVGIGKPRKDMRRTRRAHFGRIGVIDAVVVRLAVFRKDFFDFGIEGIPVHVERFFRHADSAKGLQRALERLIRLQAHDFFEVFVEIARRVRSERRDDFGIRVQHTARLLFPF